MLGSTLAHYRVIRRLGAGGMGEVYLAEDLHLKRQVALKVLPLELAASSERLERFQREAESLAALNHPNIVTIFSIERAADVRFLTMELVEGESLATLISPQGMELGRLLELALPLTDAVSAAHKKGITHRDLKPANVMVTAEGRVKVLDFGLAKLLEAQTGPAATELPTEALTQEGMAVGTVPYMSPEQIEGKTVDHRSDIFSLGILLYEMATGERPFTGDSSPALMSSILKDSPRPADELRSGLPRHLGRILEQCLEKKPQDRIQTARDVYIQLRSLRREVESGQIVTGAAEAAASRPARGPVATDRRAATEVPPAATDKSPTLFGVPVWVLFALGGMAMGMFPLWIAFRGQRSAETVTGPAAITEAARPAPAASERRIIAVLPFENLGPADQEYFADGITEEITSRLAAVGDLGVISRTSAMQYKQSRPPMQQIGEELGVGYVLEGTVRWAGGAVGSSRVRITTQLIRVADDTQMWAGSYDRVLDDIFRVQSEIAAEVIDQLGVTLLEPERQVLEERSTENLEAYQAFLRGSDSLGHLDEEALGVASRMLERAVELDPGFASAWARLARAEAVRYHFGYDRSEQTERRSREAAERALALAPESSEAHAALGYFHYHVHKDYEPAMAAFGRALEIRPDDPDALEGQALVLRRVMRWEESTRLFERALALNPRDVSLVFNLGDSYLQTRFYDQADAMFQRCIGLRPDFLYAYFYRALNFWLWRGDRVQARAMLESMPEARAPDATWAWVLQESLEGDLEAALARAERLQEEAFPLGAIARSRALLRGLARWQLGRPADARTDFESARVALEQTLRERPDSFRYRSAYALALAGLGRHVEARREAERAVRDYPVSRDSAWGPGVVEDLALVYTMTGDHDRALDRLDYLLSIPSLISVRLLEIDPRWAPLRDHPRYRQLLDNYG